LLAFSTPYFGPLARFMCPLSKSIFLLSTFRNVRILDLVSVFNFCFSILYLTSVHNSGIVFDIGCYDKCLRTWLVPTLSILRRLLTYVLDICYVRCLTLTNLRVLPSSLHTKFAQASTYSHNLANVGPSTLLLTSTLVMSSTSSDPSVPFRICFTSGRLQPVFQNSE
jgi:hypothetical protein